MATQMMGDFEGEKRVKYIHGDYGTPYRATQTQGVP